MLAPSLRSRLSGLLLVLCACGDESAATMPIDAGMDAPIVRIDAGPPPMCGANTCGSPLVGEHCCTETADVAAHVASAAGRCGTNLEAVTPQLGSICVELRQPGAIDNRCPPRSVGSVLEPGCCMPDGACGTLNQAADLGCQRAFTADESTIECGVVSPDAGNEPDAS